MRERAGRVVGIDVARFVALVGMMAIHILPAYDADGVTTSQSIAGGRSSALFAVLAGASLSLMTGRRPALGEDWPRAAAGTAVRAGLIALIGLVLGDLDTGIAVILTYYGLLFLLGIPFLVARTRTLVVLAAGWVLVGPVLSHLIRPHLDAPSGASPTFAELGRPVTLTLELLFTGYYPVFVWLAYLLVGMAVGRLDLRSWRTIGWLAGVGAVLVGTAYSVSDALVDAGRDELVAVSGGSVDLLERELAGSMHGTTPTDTWWWLVVRSAHAGTPLDLVQTVGCALVVIAVCLVLGRLAPRLSAVVFGAGAMTLTLYTVHVLARGPGGWDGDTTDVYVGQVLAVLAIGMMFGLARMKGPLEWFVALLSRFASRKQGEPFRWGSTT